MNGEFGGWIAPGGSAGKKDRVYHFL